MVKKASDLDFDALAKLAKSATAEVRAKAAGEHKALPVLLDGEVVLEMQATPVQEYFLERYVELPLKSGAASSKDDSVSMAAGSAKLVHRASNG